MTLEWLNSVKRNQGYSDIHTYMDKKSNKKGMSIMCIWLSIFCFRRDTVEWWQRITFHFNTIFTEFGWLAYQYQRWIIINNMNKVSVSVHQIFRQAIKRKPNSHTKTVHYGRDMLILMTKSYLPTTHKRILALCFQPFHWVFYVFHSCNRFMQQEFR